MVARRVHLDEREDLIHGPLIVRVYTALARKTVLGGPSPFRGSRNPAPSQIKRLDILVSHSLQ
jgi:hypothetical protein